MTIEQIEDQLTHSDEPILYGRIDGKKVVCVWNGTEDELLDILAVLIDQLGVENQVNLETFLRIRRN